VTDKDDAHLALAWGFMPNLIRQIKIGEALEIFNALGDTIAVITVPESALESLTEYEIFSVRSVAAT